MSRKVLVEDLEEGDLFKFNGEVLEYVDETAKRGLHRAHRPVALAGEETQVLLSGKSEVEYAFKLEHIIDGLRMGGEYHRRVWPPYQKLYAPNKDEYDWLCITQLIGSCAYMPTVEDLHADDWEEFKPEDEEEECTTTT